MNPAAASALVRAVLGLEDDAGVVYITHRVALPKLPVPPVISSVLLANMDIRFCNLAFLQKLN